MTDLSAGNLFRDLPTRLRDERFETLLESPGLTLKRIISTGQTTPEGEWYDQDRDEWVVLLQGGAQLLFAGEAAPRPLVPGDYVLIPAHVRHRVTWTDPEQPTVWLALHFAAGP